MRSTELAKDKHHGRKIRNLWRDKVKRTDTSYPTIYYIYLNAAGWETGSITDADAPRSLPEAERMLKSLIENPDTKWTSGLIYEVKPVVRMGVTYHKQ